MNIDELTEIMRIFYFSSFIPIKSLDNNLKVQGCFPSIDTQNYPFSIDFDKEYKKIHDVLLQFPESNKGFLYTNNYEVSYIAIGLWENNTFKGSLIVGPFILFSPDSLNIDKLVEINKMPFSIKGDLKKFYQQLSIVNHPRELYLTKFLFSLIHNNVDLSRISFINNKKIQTEEFVSDVIIRNREIEYKMTPDNLTQDLYNYVRLGDLENAKKTKDKINEYEMLELPGIEGIRNGKNLLIIYSYSLSRATIQGGVDIDYSSNLCNGFIRSVENCSSMNDLIALSDKMLKEYVKSVRKYGITKLHPAIQKALKIINKNLNENLNLNEISSKVHLHPNYFSSLFKKEMGITFQKYILKLRIQEAKRLLDYSDYSILDIALYLGFKNQSHFTSIFKTYEGCTPKAYKKKKKI
ncbi:helix-turn-helix domain-containing protein [Oceanirhabdus seepicola]|uniref:Helix-turn-helix domain-containing protein n=1 Tax=Oceanirhabdus seepicola TaxID=2828781 RepID=A0A9J6P654_9CLOT|nr:helix-turn-helix domain-containing protein [Oceanirhabdus seepicola]MCM1991740.1 helix-turn-helix domain-containing protein [Oceanirhabdus seepicola]